jgi:nucleotide-binding universal stress UspA family protein
MYDRILVPTDGSEAALAAAREAIELATDGGAELLVVYVIDESASNLFVSTKSMNDAIGEMRDRGADAVADVEAMAADAGVPVTTDVVRGMHIDEAIVDYATANDADLVVMGTFGRRGVEHLLGSTTERVLAKTTIPVLSVAVPKSVASEDAAGEEQSADE